jgi:pimeloyl-ACP methyl ester carboxylesterase
MPLRSLAGQFAPRVATAATLALALGSCSLFRLREDVKAIATHGVILVSVSEASADNATFAVVCDAGEPGQMRMLGSQKVSDSGFVCFLVPIEGTYQVGAWTDLDGDRVYDDGEPAASASSLRPMPLDATAQRAQAVVLKLSADDVLMAGKGFEIRDDPDAQAAAIAINVGEVVDLSDPRFTAANGVDGMWQPFEFLRQYGIGLYFLEPYDPQRLPVVFVHGISGSPQDWRTMIEAIDRKRFQPWFLHYPGGLRIERSATAMASLLRQAQLRYGFSEVCIVGHSMGGLTSRGAILRLGSASGVRVSHFVSISTPWGGNESAAAGVERLKYPVPSWRDVAPGSDYLTSILSEPLPDGTRHDLIFTFKSSGGIGLPNDNDGSVGVASELVPAVQQAAHSVFGLPLSHAEVLQSKDTLGHIERVLSAP